MRCFRVTYALAVSAGSVVVSAFFSGAGAAPAAMRIASSYQKLICIATNFVSNSAGRNRESFNLNSNPKMVLVMGGDHQRHSTEDSIFQSYPADLRGVPRDEEIGCADGSPQPICSLISLQFSASHFSRPLRPVFGLRAANPSVPVPEHRSPRWRPC